MSALKGRRKLKTAKWSLQEEHRAAAMLILRDRKHGNFLDQAVSRGIRLEPAGWLAGAPKP